MRIIDKNNDYYDYLQDVYKDDTLVFDRRDSFIIKRNDFVTNFFLPKYVVEWIKKDRYDLDRVNKNYFLLLQVCNTFWLFLVHIIDYDENYVGLSYDINLLTTWKDYDIKRKLIKLLNIDFIHIDYETRYSEFNNKVIEKLKDAIKHDEYKVIKDITKLEIIENKNIVKKSIPILKEIGIPELVNPIDIYLAFEEYFSLEKTSSERVESVGLTNDDKITNHGFDTKISFRGKQKVDKTGK